MAERSGEAYVSCRQREWLINQSGRLEGAVHAAAAAAGGETICHDFHIDVVIIIIIIIIGLRAQSSSSRV